ncbi:MAG TPA: hypothetical protein VEJ87_04565, partial [Acidimicrobiales bacterium]|nr:hypothetical protein [Acidimicrobiales bacterium]
NGFVGRFVTDWSGPAAIIEKVAIRLGAPNYPGDTMHLTGKVTAKHDLAPGEDGRGVVELSVRGANRLGDHMTGTVCVSLPVRRRNEGHRSVKGHGNNGGNRPNGRNRRNGAGR